MSRPLLISILGPTAVGKTELSIELAKHFDTEIISCDSRQVFRDIPIGTATPSLEEQAGVPHHFIDKLDLEEDFSAGRYEREALELIQNQLSSQKVIIQCGGSGLYAKALLEGLDEVPRDMDVREELNERFHSEGLAPLLSELKDKDPECEARIDQKNPQRVIRALEVCLATGKPYSSFLVKAPINRSFDSLVIGLRRERAELNERIAQRCTMMLKEGWIEECRRVQDKRSLNSLNTVGYKQIFRFLDGEWSLEECQAAIIQETQRFAKRQMTWFRQLKDIHWIDLPDSQLLDKVLELT